MNESMITLGCIMAKVSENDSGEITTVPGHDAKLIFLFTTESAENRIIVAPQMRELGNLGFMPIAIARIEAEDPSRFFLFSLNGLSESLRVALENQGCDLVHLALGLMASGQDGSTASN